jgi:hypothetical protein
MDPTLFCYHDGQICATPKFKMSFGVSLVDSRLRTLTWQVWPFLNCCNKANYRMILFSVLTIVGEDC